MVHSMARRFVFLSLASALCVSLAAYVSYHPVQRMPPNLSWHSPDKETRLALSSIQVEKNLAPAIDVLFPSGSTSEVTSGLVETKGWDHAIGIGLLLQPDGTSRYVDLELIDAGTGEAYKYGLSTRDPSCHQVFVPFALFSGGDGSFKPALHRSVHLAWRCQKNLDAPLTFKAGGFSVGSLDEGEFAWPASTPPFVGTPVYLETFESAPGCQPVGQASFALLMAGPPKTNIPRSLAIHLGSADAQCQWDFRDTSRWRFFDGMTIWFKMGAPNTRIELVVLAKNAQGERRFVHDMPAQGRDWVADHIEWDDFVDAKGQNFEPGDFGAMSLIVRAPPGSNFPVDVIVGPFRLDDE